jgi:hypothetical protein
MSSEKIQMIRIMAIEKTSAMAPCLSTDFRPSANPIWKLAIFLGYIAVE